MVARAVVVVVSVVVVLEEEVAKPQGEKLLRIVKRSDPAVTSAESRRLRGHDPRVTRDPCARPSLGDLR